MIALAGVSSVPLPCHFVFNHVIPRNRVTFFRKVYLGLLALGGFAESELPCGTAREKFQARARSEP
jgi:hypothetical protein